MCSRSHMYHRIQPILDTRLFSSRTSPSLSPNAEPALKEEARVPSLPNTVDILSIGDRYVIVSKPTSVLYHYNIQYGSRRDANGNPVEEPILLLQRVQDQLSGNTVEGEPVSVHCVHTRDHDANGCLLMALQPSTDVGPSSNDEQHSECANTVVTNTNPAMVRETVLGHVIHHANKRLGRADLNHPIPVRNRSGGR